MRHLIFAALLAAFATPALAQDAGVAAQMDRAEQAIRRDMAPAGVEVERAAPNDLRVRMPADITFDFNEAYIKREFFPRVRQLGRILQDSPALTISIVGHADAVGSDAYNQRLSERRAYALGNALIDEGVRRRRIEASGMGEMSPIATNASEWGRARNRRVEIRLHGAQASYDPKFEDERFQ